MSVSWNLELLVEFISAALTAIYHVIDNGLGQFVFVLKHALSQLMRFEPMPLLFNRIEFRVAKRRK